MFAKQDEKHAKYAARIDYAEECTSKPMQHDQETCGTHDCP